MTILYAIKNIKSIAASVIALCAAIAAQSANAFELSTYADNSRMSTGRWAKISVTEDGM